MKISITTTPFIIKRIILKMMTLLLFVSLFPASAISQKVSVMSGRFNDPAVWNPAGVPAATDPVIIKSGHIINVESNSAIASASIESGAVLKVISLGKLRINGTIDIQGSLVIDEGDVTIPVPGTSLKMGPTGTLYWSPADNTLQGASLFTNGDEEFHASSTLEIYKWYNYSNAPLGSVVTGDFGNVVINTMLNGLVYEWDQKNYFEQHRILGRLTINEAWVILDKTGAITNTSIGSIQLNDVNSYLDIHVGNHPSSFTLTTGEIINNGGTINGLVNGNGNINLDIKGNVINKGNMCLVYNSGVNNTANGNAYLNVEGVYQQSHGDFRGIFNISTTLAGKANMDFGSIEMTGGVFMANYACHTSSQTSKINITGNLTLNLSGNNSKFRLNGLTSLGGIPNNVRLNLNIQGNLVMNGSLSSEFITSASSGNETVVISGEAVFNGGNSFFNYTTHPTEILFEKSVKTHGGTVYFSKADGSLSLIVNRSFEITSGTVNIKGGKGFTNFSILENYNQTGGTLYFHNNEIDPTSNVIYTTVYGDFTNVSGTIIFDNNSASTAKHMLSLNGSSFNAGGSANFSTVSSLATPVYGTIFFDNPGEMAYHISGDQVVIDHVKQNVGAGCIVKILTGNLLAGTSNTIAHDMVTIASGGTIDLGDNQVHSGTKGLYSGIQVDEGGRLRISNPAGLYDGTHNASVKAAPNMGYSLNKGSIVEYYGDHVQTVTGTGLGTATQEFHQYGVLEINKPAGKAVLSSSNVTVRKTLSLQQGELDLNNFNIIVNSGKPSSIFNGYGYIKSEPENLAKGGQVIWNNIEGGYHLIQFGTAPNKIIPFSFTPSFGTGNSFVVSTRNSSRENRPLPAGIPNLNYNGVDAGKNYAIDRWYFIQANGTTANITLSYLPEENSLPASLATQNFSAMLWNTAKWNGIGGTGNGMINQVGKVTVNNNNAWGYMLMISNPTPQTYDIIEFTAEPQNKEVKVKWKVKANIPAEIYYVERSVDGLNYTMIHEEDVQPNSTSTGTFEFIDTDPAPGLSYYRLKQEEVDGTLKYSQIEKIEFGKKGVNNIEIVSAGPNPFTDQFFISYYVTTACNIEIKIMSTGGNVIYNKTEMAEQGTNKFNYVDNTELPKGIYLVNISDGISQVTHKMIKR